MRPERSGPVAGVVLAAGSSSRMGRNKLLFELGGETVVRRAVRGDPLRRERAAIPLRIRPVDPRVSTVRIGG